MHVNVQLQTLLQIAQTLNEHQIDYALCGGLAVNAYGHNRSTADIDLIIQKQDLERIRALVEPLGFDLSSGLISFGFGTPNYRELLRLNKVIQEDVLTLDLMMVTPILEDVWRTKETILLGLNPIQIVSLQGLEKMKRLAGRYKDLGDLVALGLEQERGQDD